MASTPTAAAHVEQQQQQEEPEVDLYRYSHVELFTGLHGPSHGSGTVTLTSRRLLWNPDTTTTTTTGGGGGGGPFVLDFKDIIMHAVCRTTDTFPKPCLYCEVDTGEREEDTDEGAGGDHVPEEDTTMRVGVNNSHPQTQRIVPAEFRLSPSAETRPTLRPEDPPFPVPAADMLEELFEAFSHIVNLTTEEGSAAGEDDFFFNEQAVMEGLPDHNVLKRKLDDWDSKFQMPEDEDEDAHEQQEKEEGDGAQNHQEKE